MVSQAEHLTIANMTLINLLERYQASVECSPRYAESLRRTVRKAEANGLLKIRQLATDRVNDFLSSLTLSPVTIGNIRRELLTLWRYAYEEGLTESQPTRIRKVRAPLKPVVCWTKPELERLWECAKDDETRVSTRLQVCRRDVLPAWIAISYDTGMRFGDVHGLKASSILRGFVVATASKTGKQLVRQLSPLAIKEAAQLSRLSPDGSLFAWCLPRRRALKMWRQFLDEHGFGGSSKWLRRCAATQLAMGHGNAAATALLQHSHPSLVLKHYIDQTQFSAPAAPPPISGGTFLASGSPSSLR
jgi:integrase